MRIYFYFGLNSTNRFYSSQLNKNLLRQLVLALILLLPTYLVARNAIYSCKPTKLESGFFSDGTHSNKKLSDPNAFSGLTHFINGEAPPMMLETSIWSNTITGANPSASNPYTTGDVINSNITVSGIRRGPSVLEVSTADRYNAYGWNSASLNGLKYFEFTLAPNPGYKINFSSFVFNGVTNASGPLYFELQSSVDAFENSIGVVYDGSNTLGLSSNDFQGVTSTITFRLYAWGASSIGGTFGIDDFTFNGSVVSDANPIQPIWSNLITNSNPSAFNPFTSGDVVDPNITVTGIGRSSGISAYTVSNRYDAIGWESSGLDANDYFEFTLTPNTNHKINLESFVFDGQTSSADAPTEFALQSSIDNFSSQMIVVEDLNTIDLTNAIFQNITQTITFRIYAWGASSANGRYGINSFTFNGTVETDTQSVVSIWSNPIISSNPSAFNPYSSGDVRNVNITVSGISRGSGLVAKSTVNRYDATGWDSPSFDANDYFEFTLQPNSGYKINLNSFVFDGQLAGSTAPTNFALRSNIDNYTSDIGVVQDESNTISLTASLFQNITSQIIFRLYAWGGSSTLGRYGINSFEFKGTLISYPGGVSGISLWLKADEGVTVSGSDLTSWIDQSGTNTFTVYGAPNYNSNAINFNQSVSFNNNGVSGSLPTNYLAGNTNITYVDAFAVYKFDDNSYGQSNFLGSVDNPSPSTRKGLVVFGGSGTNNSWVRAGSEVSGSEEFRIQNSGFNNLNFGIVNLDVNLATSPYGSGRLNGVSQAVIGSTPDFSSINFKPMIGGTNNNGLSHFGHMKSNGQLAEVIIFPTGLSEADKLKIESYLAVKYGISLGSNADAVAYTNSVGTTIWPSNSTYMYDIFGIAKDYGSGLNQTSSNSINTGSGDGTGQSGKGNIVVSNPSSIVDGDFLLIGHDSLALSEQSTELPPSVGVTKRLSREWLVKETGEVGTITMSFNTTGLTLTGTSASDFKLLIKNNSSDFSTGTMRTIDVASYTNNIITFTGVNLANNDYFTLITAPSAPLPVSLVSFSGVAKIGLNELSWVTNSEHNNDYFTLQRSQDNTNFEKIGEVKGVGESSQTNAYTYNDYTKGLKGAQYYRLLQTDYDGRQSIGPTIVLDNTIENTTISYSLALHKLVLNINSESNQEIEVELYAVDGRMVLSTAQKIKQGANQVSISLPEFIHGLYLLNVKPKDQTIAIKIFIP